MPIIESIPERHRKRIRPFFEFSLTKPRVWSSIRAILTIFPFALLTVSKYQLEDPTIFGFDLEILFNEAWKILLWALSPAFLSIAFDVYEYYGRFLNDRRKGKQPEVHMAKTLGALNVIVGEKLDRLGTLAKQISVQPMNVKEVFDDAVKPEIQLKRIVEQIGAFLNSDMPDRNYHIVLAKIENNKPCDFVGHYPVNEKPSETLINKDNCFFSYVAKKSSYQYIENIQTYLNSKRKAQRKAKKAKFQKEFFELENTAEGSIAGIPIKNKYLNEISYVLTIKSDEEHAIKSDFKDKYLATFKIFFDRILLEDCLKYIQVNLKDYDQH